MKTAGKLAAGWLLLAGFFSITTATSALLAQPTTQRENGVFSFLCGDFLDQSQQNRDQAASGLIYGVPSLLLGGWLAWELYRQGKQEGRDRLHAVFYRLLKEGNGQLTVLQFALETQLPAPAAKQYLQEKAKEFDATFHVSDEGGISYHFNQLFTLSLLRPEISPSSTFASLSSSDATGSRSSAVSVTPSSSYWSLGSSRDEVLREQGTPTKVEYDAAFQETMIYYGRSTIKISEEKGVVGYENLDKNLKVRCG